MYTSCVYLYMYLMQMIADQVRTMEAAAVEYIQKTHQRPGALAAVFTYLETEQKIQCNACHAARNRSKGKSKSKQPAAPKTNQLRTVGDAYNFNSQHCILGFHMRALDVWGGQPRVSPPVLVALVDRLRTLDPAHRGSDGKDCNYAYAGTSAYTTLEIKDHSPYCSACDLPFSMFHNNWIATVADHFISAKHKSKTCVGQAKLDSFFGSKGKEKEK